MLAGTSRAPVVCHPARSSSSTAWAPSATQREIVEMELHRLGVSAGQGERRADAAGWANRSEQIGVFVR